MPLWCGICPSAAPISSPQTQLVVITKNLTIDLHGATITDGVCHSAKGNRVEITDNGETLRMMNSFSYVIQGGLTSTANNWDVLFGLGEAPNWNIKIANNASGNLTFLEEGYTIKDKVAETATPTTELGTYIVTVDNGGKTTERVSPSSLTLYYNGAVVATATLGENNCTNEFLDMFAIGGRSQGTNNSSDFTFTNVQLYSGVLSQEQIASLSIPEPTTATLSLLALAGLAARRRRR